MKISPLSVGNVVDFHYLYRVNAAEMRLIVALRLVNRNRRLLVNSDGVAG